MSNDPLQSPKLKLEQANRHIIDATTQIRAFTTSGDLVETFLEPDPDGLRQIVKARALKKPPLQIALTTADAIGNMRSALDHLVYCLAIKNSANPKGAAFPFARSWKEFLGEKRKIAPLSSEAQQMICDLQPFPISEEEPDKGGNNKLWAMNRVRNVDVHQMIAPIGMVSLGHSASLATRGHLGRNIVEAPRRICFDEDMTAVVMKVPGKPEDIIGHLTAAIDVGFGEIDCVAGAPVLMVLTDFFELASRIVADAEKRFFT